MDSNHRPLPCQGSALTRLSYGPTWNGGGTRAIPPEATLRVIAQGGETPATSGPCRYSNRRQSPPASRSSSASSVSKSLFIGLPFGKPLPTIGRQEAAAPKNRRSE